MTTRPALIALCAALAAAPAAQGWAADRGRTATTEKDGFLGPDMTLINDLAPQAERWEGDMRIGQAPAPKKALTLKELLKRFSRERDVVKKERLLDEIAGHGLRAGKRLLRIAQRDKDKRTRSMAFRGLGMIKYGRAVPALRRALTDKSAWIRSSAAWSLGEMRAGKAEKALVRLLSREKRAAVVESAVYALERMQARGSLGAVKKAGSHHSAYTRSWILRSVARLGGRTEIRYIAGFLEDMDPRVQATAVEVLQSFTGKDFGLPKSRYEDPAPAIKRARDWWDTEGRHQ